MQRSAELLRACKIACMRSFQLLTIKHLLPKDLRHQLKKETLSNNYIRYWCLGNISDAELADLLIREKGLLRLLNTIGGNRYYTRELLKLMKEWGYGHRLLRTAESLRLVKRERKEPEGKGNWRVYNSLTEKGKKALALARK